MSRGLNLLCFLDIIFDLRTPWDANVEIRLSQQYINKKNKEKLIKFKSFIDNYGATSSTEEEEIKLEKKRKERKEYKKIITVAIKCK